MKRFSLPTWAHSAFAVTTTIILIVVIFIAVKNSPRQPEMTMEEIENYLPSASVAMDSVVIQSPRTRQLTTADEVKTIKGFTPSPTNIPLATPANANAVSPLKKAVIMTLFVLLTIIAIIKHKKIFNKKFWKKIISYIYTKPEIPTSKIIRTKDAPIRPINDLESQAIFPPTSNNEPETTVPEEDFYGLLSDSNEIPPENTEKNFFSPPIEQEVLAEVKEENQVENLLSLRDAINLDIQLVEERKAKLANKEKELEEKEARLADVESTQSLLDEVSDVSLDDEAFDEYRMFAPPVAQSNAAERRIEAFSGFVQKLKPLLQDVSEIENMVAQIREGKPLSIDSNRSKAIETTAEVVDEEEEIPQMQL
jgi:hypothetical protein